jgi:arylsulfatase A-like enzyme
MVRVITGRMLSLSICCRNFANHFREKGVGDNWTSFPEYFKNNGYLTYGAGKLYHPMSPPNNDYPRAWTSDAFNSYYWGNNKTSDALACMTSDQFENPIAGFCTAAPCVLDNSSKWCRHTHMNQTNCSYYGVTTVCPGNADTNDDEFYDHRVGTRGIEMLEHAHAKISSLRSNYSNFFIGVGFRRPHLDWRMPRRFWEMYNNGTGADNRTISVAKHQSMSGSNTTLLAYERNGPLSAAFTQDGKHFTTEGPNTPLPRELQAVLRRGYYSAVSFMDYEVGRFLNAIDRLGFKDNTGGCPGALLSCVYA